MGKGPGVPGVGMAKPKVGRPLTDNGAGNSAPTKRGTTSVKGRGRDGGPRTRRALLLNFLAFGCGAYVMNTANLMLRRHECQCPYEVGPKTGTKGLPMSFRTSPCKMLGDGPNRTLKVKTGASPDEQPFHFPSRDQRVEYYMGDWSGRTLGETDLPCGEIKERNVQPGSRAVDVLWQLGPLDRHVKREKGWRTLSYLVHLHRVLTANETSVASDSDRSVIFLLGDQHSRSTTLPVVAKTRFSRFAVSKKSGEKFFSTIIWPMEMKRHYDDPIGNYLNLQSEGKVLKWEDKRDALIWRGSATGVLTDKTIVKDYPDGGWRISVVKRYFAKRSRADVAFTDGDAIKLWRRKYGIGELVRSTDTTMEDQLKYKYIFMLEGNDVATGLKWQLLSNSVVFMARPTCVSFAMEDTLVPFVHYVPLKDDYSNLEEMIEWARKNDAKCKWIAEQATRYIERLWVSDEAKEENRLIMQVGAAAGCGLRTAKQYSNFRMSKPATSPQDLGEAYHRQFGAAIKSCHK